MCCNEGIVENVNLKSSAASFEDLRNIKYSILQG